MFFFDKNLKMGHKLTLYLVLLGILANVFVLFDHKYRLLEWLTEDYIVSLNVTHTVVAFGTLVKCIVLCIFRKF